MPPRIVSTKENKKPRVVKTKEGEDFSLILQKEEEDAAREPTKPEEERELRGPNWAEKKREQAGIDIEAIKNQIEEKRVQDSPVKKARKWFEGMFK